MTGSTRSNECVRLTSLAFTAGFIAFWCVLLLPMWGANNGVGHAEEEDLQATRDYFTWGKELAYSAKGNCSACHTMSTDDENQIAGNLGPALVAMKLRYTSIDELRTQIYNATAKNPNSIMPPFGSHGILTEEEIDAITAFVWEL